MKHITLPNLKSEQRFIPEGEIVVVHADKEKTSAFLILNEDTVEEQICFAVKIGNEMYLSDFFRKDMPDSQAARDKVNQCAKQIYGVKQLGWHKTGHKTYTPDEDGFQEYLDEFVCAYCQAKTTNPRSACICRKAARIMSRV